MWQDLVLGVGQWIFLIALLPTIFSRVEKPTLLTCILTAVIASIFAYTYYTLGLWNALFGAIGLSTGWYILAYQRWKLNRSTQEESNSTR